MSVIPPDADKVQVRDGVSPKAILEERGGVCDGGGFLPDMPDYLGYLLSLLLLWLVLTGYKSVVAVFQDPQTHVSRLSQNVERTPAQAGVQARITPAQVLSPEPGESEDTTADTTPTPAAEPISETAAWWSLVKEWVTLDNINLMIDRAIEYTGETFDGVYSGELPAEISSTSKSSTKPRTKPRTGKQQHRTKSVDYEYFQ